MAYVPTTDGERAKMLGALDATSVDDLFRDIPAAFHNPAIDLPPALREIELRALMSGLGARNAAARQVCFAGYGAYDHYIPCALDTLASRGEFTTSYTPYQAEISQGNLQAIYEYQTMLADLCGQEIANASLYDGATALFEAAMMAVRIGKSRRHVVLDLAVHPHYRQTLSTLAAHLALRITGVASRDGCSDLAALAVAIEADTAAVVTASPNVFGAVCDLDPLARAAHARGALLVCSTHPLVSGVLRPVGKMGADIVCGEGQPLGLPLSFGGPYLGFLACRQEYARMIPGRLVGATVDARGRRAFCLALQTREQHIRREKATSNICTNQALCALRAAIYLALLGERGVRQVAERCATLAHYARTRLARVRGVRLDWSYPCFNEFAIQTERRAADVLSALARRGFLAGVDLGRVDARYDHAILVAVTEKRTVREIDALAEALGAVLAAAPEGATP